MSAPETEELTQDEVFDLLSNARRRFILSYLQQADGPVDIFELATEIGAVENDIPVEEVSDKQEKRLYVSIYQTHIPKLESAGLIEYDSDSGKLRLLDRTEEFGDFLPKESNSRPWHLYYLTLAITSMLALVVATFAPGVQSGVEFFVQALIVLAFVALSLFHVYTTRIESDEPSLEWLSEQ